MKAINTKRWLSVLLVLCMAASLFATPALAVTVNTTPGNTELEVEYFTSTLYNWDEDAANAATMEADKTAGEYKGENVRYDRVAYQDQSEYTATNYFHKVENEYYPVYYTRTSSGFWWVTTTYSLYYKIGNEYNLIDTTTTGRDTELLYTSTASYEGKGLYFTNVDTKPDESVIPAFSSWTGNNQNYFIYSGLAEKYLDDATNAPFSNENVNAANLFATDGSNEAYTEVYENVKVPFVYDETTGYYTLNSDLNAVYFENGDPADGETMAIADRPAVFYQYVERTENTKYYGTGFQPFNNLQSRASNQDVTMCAGTGTTRGYKTTPEIHPDETNDEILDKHYGFGMVTEVPFQMTDSGTDANGNDIVFTFSGDDDVWVYVDGVLALDIGGTHDAIFGEINFRTGEVTLTAPYYGNIGDKNAANNPNHSVDDQYTSRKLYQTNLYDALGTTRTGFAAKGQHTLTVYYMDRGRGSTNCVIQFNLPQRDSVSVTKEISPYYTNTTGSQVSIPDDVMATLNQIPFTFTIYKNGKPVSNASYSIMKNGQFVDTASTDRNGTFRLLNGQTASFRNISLDDNQSWYVVENTPGERWTGSWSATSSVSGVNFNGVSGFTSDTVTVTGSATATDTISFVCTNAYAYQSELSVDVTGETSVLDYGLPVVVDVMANDLITPGGELESLEITNTNDLKYGTAVVDEGKIKYTLTKEFNGIETVEYRVTAFDTNNSTIKASDTGTLTIIPATSVYYEEDFEEMVTYKKSSGATWEHEGSSRNGYQESGLLTDPSCSTYGTDVFYLKQSGHSNGTTMHANAPAGHAAQFEYDFTGTGTTIYGMINATTGYICVEVTDTASNKNVDYQYIDNVVLKNEHFDFIYNNPFYSITDLAYGKYHVVVYLYPAGTPTSAGTSGPDLYLDGIRVYNPMGTEEKPGEGYSTAAFAYSQDGEANTVVVNIRSKLANPIEGAGENPEGGFVTITDLDGNLATVDEYARKGPNEELYLNGSNYKLSFAVQNWDSQSYKMYLGIKAPTDTSAKVMIGTRELTIQNSTDCYYDISDYIQVKQTDNGNFGYVNIQGVEGLVSLTNIKVTGDYEFELVPKEDKPGNPDGDVEGGVDETATRKLVMMSVADANALIGGNVDEPEEDQPVEEAPAFTPGSVKTSCVYSRLLRVATVTVTTSKDVDYVTINGRTVNGVTLFGSRYYTRAFTGISSGETLEIVCYNADGVASQVYTVVAK